MPLETAKRQFLRHRKQGVPGVSETAQYCELLYEVRRRYGDMLVKAYEGLDVF